MKYTVELQTQNGAGVFRFDNGKVETFPLADIPRGPVEAKAEIERLAIIAEARIVEQLAFEATAKAEADALAADFAEIKLDVESKDFTITEGVVTEKLRPNPVVEELIRE